MPKLYLRKGALLAMLFSMVSMVSSNVIAHGTITSPPSRIYQCYSEGPENLQSAACQAAHAIMGSGPFYDWMSIAQGNANDNHQAVVPDGKLCSGNVGKFNGLDLARNDWVGANFSSGSQTFTWTNTAPHNTAYYDYYITRNGHNHSQALRWSDLEFVCRVGPSSAHSTQSHTCNFPSRTGKHIVYSVWQRTLSQSPEAFYACVDVTYSGGGSSSGGSSSGGSTSGGGSSGGGSSSGGSSSGGSGGGQCSGIQTWSASQTYTGGTEVQYQGVRYRAKWWTQGDNPAQSGQWGVWENLGSCGGGSSSSGGSSSGGSSSGGSSSGGSSSGGSSSGGSGGGNCGAPYVDGANYGAGDKVSNGGNSYECKVAGWCSIGGPYAPGSGWAWPQAWTDLGPCS